MRNGPRSWVMAGVIGVVAIGFLGMLYRESRESDRRLDSLQETLKAEAPPPTPRARSAGSPLDPRSVSFVNDGGTRIFPASAGSPLADAPVAMRPEAQLLIEDCKLNRQQWTRLVQVNGEWLTALREAQKDPAKLATVEVAAQAHFLALQGIFQTVPGGLKRYRDFESTLLGTRIAVQSPNGTRYDGVEFQ